MEASKVASAHQAHKKKPQSHVQQVQNFLRRAALPQAWEDFGEAKIDPMRPLMQGRYRGSQSVTAGACPRTGKSRAAFCAAPPPL
jgi:hypothetical protein